MRYRLLFVIAILSLQTISAQFKNDNISFRTVYINDLCDSLSRYPDRLILDVRSRGEFADTSSSASLNIGRLKGAVNIDVNEVKNRLNEIRAYKDKPVFVICSHSQRSRVCSKMLADSGFTRVINVNGAMTEFNLIKNSSVTCAPNLYETANRFTLLSPADIARLLGSGKPVFILDVRSDSAFRSISTDPSVNALGRFRGAINIPFTQLPRSLASLPKDKSILVVADFGRDINLAAKLLTDNGFTDVSAAFNGLSEWTNTSTKDLPQKNQFWEHTNKFSYIASVDFDDIMTARPSTLVIDVRTKDEFNNKVTDRPWLNRGRIQGAINIPAADLPARLAELNGFKDKNIILHAFSTNPEVFQAAKILSDNGFSRVYVLAGGLWSLRAKAANLKGLNRLMKWVVDVPEENR